MRRGSIGFVLFGTVLLPLPSQGSATIAVEGTQAAPTRAQAEARSAGCLSCHAGIEPMHASPAVHLGCIDCHGGDASVSRAPGTTPDRRGYQDAKSSAHVQPLFPEAWSDARGSYSSANPERAYTLTLRESAEFIRFVNPGDLRVAQEACGGCHQAEVKAVRKSPMTTSAIFWAAAGYANGILGSKAAVFGESYGRDGEAQRIEPVSSPTPAEQERGALSVLYPLPRWEITQPGEYFRAFEPGGMLQPSAFPDIGNPAPAALPGHPDLRLSARGPGTGLRVSPAIINLHKTRLNDPHLSLFGTNDHPGDYRASGCSACHVVYANDRDPVHSGPYAAHGNRGRTDSDDPTLCGERQAGLCSNQAAGHPIRHRFTRAIPSSQCMVCHMHQPNAFVNSYLGYTLWDYETDGESLWPEQQRYPTEAEKQASLEHNPEGAAVRGLWTDRDFLADVSRLNPRLEHTRLADYHGHGWVFRAVFKRDREGRLLDAEDLVVPFDDPQRFEKAVHLRDIHAERGMHCVDCHFAQDVHGDGLLHGEYGNAIEISCEDCHGTVDRLADLRTSGPAAPAGGGRLERGTTPDGRRRFVYQGERLYQRSMLEPGREWEVVQVKHTITRGHPSYNPRSRYAKTVQRDGSTWGQVPAAPDLLAHSASSMTCYACHSSWITSCSGCHLPQEANHKTEMNRYEGLATRNYASYNPQVIRADAYMLGINGTALGNRVAPVRSSSALVLSSTNADRERLYLQQPPISTPGFSSQAFNPHVPHTVRSRETKACDDCHVSRSNDNNAWLAQLLTLGTNFVNFVGRYAWVGEGEAGVEAVAVTEWEEPQAVLGSYLHRLAYPDDFAAHTARGLELPHAYHQGGGDVLDLQQRGEYLFVAGGSRGLEVLDIAGVDNRSTSDRIVRSPYSPLGQGLRVKSRYATALALPTTMPVAATRDSLPENQEQAIHPLYRFALFADRYEGIILVDIGTLTDRDPRNNFLERALTFNPEGELAGAQALTVAGNHVYVGCERGLVVVDFGLPLAPRIVARLPQIQGTTGIVVQFRYAFVAEGAGMTVVDITRPAAPVIAARLPLPGQINAVYVARTYAYLAAGAAGLAIVDVVRPEEPRLVEVFNAGGRLSDTRDVQIGSTNASLFAYVADGKSGLAVLQLTSPEMTPEYLGFSPRPRPRLIATRRTRGPALALSKGLDRDRAVDESGNQVSVFSRIGARPFTLTEMQRLYLRDGRVYAVDNAPAEPPQEADDP